MPLAIFPDDGVRSGRNKDIDLAPSAWTLFACELHGHESLVRIPLSYEHLFHTHIGIGQSIVVPLEELLELLDDLPLLDQWTSVLHVNFSRQS